MAVKLRHCLTVLLTAVILAAVFLLPLPFRRVCIQAVHVPDGKNRPWVRPMLVLPENAAHGFVISYTHSVNKGRVFDFYAVLSDGRLCLEKTRFSSYGAGMPEPEDWPGQRFVETADYIEMQNINRIVDGLTMAVGVIAAHAVEMNNVSYPLVDYFVPQTRVYIEYRRVTAFQLLTCRLKVKKAVQSVDKR